MAKLSSTHIYGDLSVDSAITENGQLLSSKYAAASHGTHLTLGTGSGNAFRGDYGNTAYNHSKAAHAPSNAQKNSDITKAEIEAKLTGAITSHTHAYSPTSHASTATTYGVSSASNYGHAMASGTTPKANGTAAVGSETAKFARGDHVHPLQTTVSGNAGTATKFASAQSVALTGDVTGSASSQAGWSVATTLKNSGVTAGSYGPSANASPAHSGTFSVPYLTVDAKGRVTAASTKTITLPASGNTDTKVTYTLGTTTKYYMGGPTATATGTGGITFDTGIYATTTAGQLSVGSFQTRGDITTSGNGSHAIGSTANRFSGIYGANIYSYDKNAKQYASLRLQTEGTADTQGVGRLTAGNNTNAGTAGNAKGQILLYGTNTGYTTITPGYNDTSNITLTLPSAGGTLARTSDNITGSSASCTGNAATATKLKTARSINGTNFDGTGNITTANWGTARKINQISVNGSADVKLPLDHYTCSVGDNNTKLYHHILSTGKVTGSWEDKSILIVIDGHYNGSGFGIARAVLRTNDAANGATASGEIKWLVRSGFSENQLCYNIRNTAKDTYMDVFYKSGGAYASATWYILSEGGRGSHGSQWTKNNTNASGTNAYTEAAMKALRSYTATLQSAADHGAVSSAKTAAACSGNVATATKLKTARTLTIGATGKTFDGSGDVKWSLQDIMKGQGLNAGTAMNTLYYNNAGKSHVGRLSCYNGNDGDYVQLGLYNTSSSSTVSTLNLYANHARFSRYVILNEYIRPNSNGSIDMGASNYRWRTVYSANGVSTTSDRTLKENIKYVRSGETEINYNDMYNFVKNDLELATYNYINSEERHINFIAQDLLANEDGTDNKVGQFIINPVPVPAKEDIENGEPYPLLSYNTNIYTSILAGALKESIDKIEKLESEKAKMQSEIDELKADLTELKAIVKGLL